MGLQSTLSKASSKGESLRATVPEGIVSFLNLHEGDKLDWQQEVIDGRKIVLVQRPIA